MFAYIPRCGPCAVGAVESPAQLSTPTKSVVGGLQGIGLSYRSDVHVELRSKSKLVEQLGPDSFHALAVTRSLVRPNGRTSGRIVVTMTAGLPDPLFRTVFAHELMHAVMRDRHINGLPLPVEEGMAQFIAYAYLNYVDHGIPQKLTAQLIDDIVTRDDPVYGGGFRAVRRAVSRFGFRTVFVAMGTQDLGSVGLP